MEIKMPQEIIDMKMPATEKLALAYVLTHVAAGVEFTLTNIEIGKVIGVRKRQASTVMNSLIDKGLLESTMRYKPGSKQIDCRVVNITTGVEIDLLTDVVDCVENLIPKNNKHVSTSVNSLDKKQVSKLVRDRLNSFQEWYLLYDLKKSKKNAERAWLKIDPVLYPTIMEHSRLFVQNTYKDDRYPSRPHPATYLNGERWTDEIVPIDSDENFREKQQEKWRDEV